MSAEQTEVQVLSHTIKTMVEILDNELDHTKPDGDMAHPANHSCLKHIKASYEQLLNSPPVILQPCLLKLQRESLIKEIANYDRAHLPSVVQKLVNEAIHEDRTKTAERVKQWIDNDAKKSIFDIILDK